MSTISGTVPSQSELQNRTPGQGGPPPGGFGGRGNASFDATTITGVDETKPSLGALTAGQVTKGSYFASGDAKEAILDAAFAKTKGKAVGDAITIAKRRYTIVGLAKTPLGGQAADVYVKLAQLQKLSDRIGRVNTLYVRATSAEAVDAVAKSIRKTISGASVTTASALAGQITGSLSSAKDLTQKLGFALELIGLVGAVLIASLLTLTSVTKRIREFGTLKALGWSRRLVVRQVAGESLAQGILGGAAGVLVGLAGAAAITLFAPTLKASVASAAQSTLPGPFGQGAATPTAASESVQLAAHVSLGVVVLAVALAIAGGLVAGAAGAFRASRLRPVEALRHIDL
jgi:ABC-type antimicrobial peptide transport system permease subunit